jgi:uncharacterized protein YjbJ (UPF0337 family)
VSLYFGSLYTNRVEALTNIRKFTSKIKMSNWSDKVNEQYDKSMGSAKETTGNMMNDTRLESEGSTQNTSGQVQGMMNSASDMDQNFSDNIQGAVDGISNAMSGKSSNGNSNQ